MEKYELYYQILKDLLPVIGIIAGLLLSTITDLIKDRPKVKVEFKKGEFSYFNYNSPCLFFIIP